MAGPFTVPDPLPVDRPTELDDEAFALAIARNVPPPLANVRDRANLLTTNRIIVSFLILGRSYTTTTKQGKTINKGQGYYFLSVVYGRDNLIRRLRDAERRFHTPGEQGAWSIGFSTALIPLASQEERFEVAGWGLREKPEREEEE